ncbi:hypothetical protein E2C01_013688 [Portunus trituberculatus]|uniref:Uncharacterized protein n=1 Tax=Portunus trituberculatus TaxID=210409 RepID=A0A5B7DHW2_PORTR|nr:hypothetical protein [Portunus trituberculatus]
MQMSGTKPIEDSYKTRLRHARQEVRCEASLIPLVPCRRKAGQDRAGQGRVCRDLNVRFFSFDFNVRHRYTNIPFFALITKTRRGGSQNTKGIFSASTHDPQRTIGPVSPVDKSYDSQHSQGSWGSGLLDHIRLTSLLELPHIPVAQSTVVHPSRAGSVGISESLYLS